jgi:hypothetical protein
MVGGGRLRVFEDDALPALLLSKPRIVGAYGTTVGNISSNL